MLDKFLLCFVPLFVAVDAVGILPMFMGFTKGMERNRLRTVVVYSIITATVVAVIFLVAGPGLLRLMGISIYDFMVAGGLLLFIFSTVDLFSQDKLPRRMDPDSLGVVPLGVPLITGPAVLTTIILLVQEHGIYYTGSALLMNMALTGSVLLLSARITDLIGITGSNILSRIADLFLAAIGIMILRKGIYGLIGRVSV